MPPIAKSLEGQKFGNWTVFERTKGNLDRVIYYRCVCSCGNEKIINKQHLTKGDSTSCGCIYTGTKGRLKPDALTRLYPKEYTAWIHMKARCYNSNDEFYRIYGGRGISVCEAWKNSFKTFLEDIGPSPGKTYSIDRIDTDGNYEKSNVRWATPSVQANNKRTNNTVEYEGKNQSLADWAREYNLKPQQLQQRIRFGWSFEDAIKTPFTYRRKESR